MTKTSYRILRFTFFLFPLSIAISLLCGCRKGELPALIDEYRQLRQEREQSSGNEWINELDSYGGRLHVVMTQLGEILGNSSYSRSEIVQLLGEPNAIREEENQVYLIYFWRG
jgi:hypothetical protein